MKIHYLSYERMTEQLKKLEEIGVNARTVETVRACMCQGECSHELHYIVDFSKDADPRRQVVKSQLEVPVYRLRVS